MEIKPEPLGSESDFSALCRQVTDSLGRAYDLPREQMQQEVHQAALVLVELRDQLIKRLRRDGADAFHPWRQPLDRVNQAASLIAGIEYPSSGFNRDYMEEARKITMGIEANL